MRPLNKPKKTNEDFAKQVWQSAEAKHEVEKVEEEEVFHLSQKEANKCRFVMVNNTTRMAECTVHTQSFTHGVRLHPPHLWNIIEGIVYQKVNGEWVRWSPIVKENIKRFEE